MVTSNEFKLPDVGEGLTEAEIVSWHVAVGDTVKVNDVVCEIETAKSVVELPSPYAGVVQALLVAEGETVEVGTPIIRIGDAVDGSPESSAPSAGAVASESPESSGPPAPTDASAEESGADDETPLTLVGPGPKESAVTRRPRKVATGAEAARIQTQAVFESGPFPHVEVEHSPEPQSAPAQGPAAEPAAERASEPASAGAPDSSSAGVVALAKPPVRKLAKDLGVDLRTLTPSREDGVITRSDVEAAAPAGRAARPPAGERVETNTVAPAGRAARPPAGERVETNTVAWGADREWREPIKGVRKMMGQAMVDSAFTLPHVTIWTTVDVTLTTELVERLKGHRAFREVKVSPLLIVAKACLLALRRTPVINSVWDDAAQEIVFKRYVNLGIAAATPRGLVVPNIKDADAMALPELATAIGELTATARAGKTPPADQAGGTFTITNVGPFGMDGGTPIINPGESAILCLGAVKRQPWVVGTGAEERIEPRDVCTLGLSFDHRHIDGESGSRFLTDVASVVEDPANALLL